MNETPTKPPPSWALEPVTAWVCIAITIGLLLTPVYPLGWVLAIALAVVTYLDRRAHHFPVFWWTAAVVVFGAFAYVFFVYKRPRVPIVFTPDAAFSQQARMVRGLPPQQATAAAPTTRSPAGWYEDPTGNARVRYWDGSEWTDHTAE
jgi:hypothetical protein